MKFWTVQKEWPDSTVYVIAGGPSAAFQNLAALKGRRVIAVNSSYEAVPFADVLFFGDHRWYVEHHGRPAFREFEGRRDSRVVTVSKAAPGPNLLKLRRISPPPGLSPEPNAVVSQRTSLQGATNLAVHLGAKRIVWVGADMCRDDNGKSHHHTPHRWRNKAGNKTWDIQMEQLIHVADSAKSLGVEIVNASPVSRIPWFPKVATIEETFT